MLSDSDMEETSMMDMGERVFVDRAVQTGDDEEDLVQISVSLSELLYRVKAYQRYKRCQLDVSNQAEFCHQVDASESSCARTCAAHFRRSTKSRFNTQNDSKPLTMLEKFQKSMSQANNSSWERGGRASTSSSSLLGLTERISNMEQVLCIQGGNRPKDLLSRVAQLELRLLAIEGQSQEYLHAQTGSKCLPSNKIQ